MVFNRLHDICGIIFNCLESKVMSRRNDNACLLICTNVSDLFPSSSNITPTETFGKCPLRYAETVPLVADRVNFIKLLLEVPGLICSTAQWLSCQITT